MTKKAKARKALAATAVDPSPRTYVCTLAIEEATPIKTLHVCGNIVASFKAHEPVVTIYELATPVSPGQEPSSEAIRASTPLVTLRFSDVRSLNAIQEWVGILRERFAHQPVA